jgi:hypothetical protein
MDALPDLGTVAGIAAVVLILIQLGKAYLPSDGITRLVAVALGIVLAMVYIVVKGQTAPADFLTGFLRGLEGGFAAMGGYQALSSLNVLKSKAG